MNQRELERLLLNHAIDGEGKPLPKRLAERVEGDEEARREWRRLCGWARMLKNPEPWRADGAFIDKLAETGMREKKRAALADAVSREIGWTNFRFRDVLRAPVRLPRPVLAVMAALVFLLPALYYGHREYSHIGTFDYVSGNVIASAGAPLATGAGKPVERGAGVQTARDAESVLTLEDGTEVLVGSLTHLVLEGPRHVRVERGRAYFDIPKGGGGFKVRVPRGEVAVLGTAFEVRVEPDETVVTVTDGVVQLSGGGASVKAPAGNEGILARGSAPKLRPVRSLQPTERWVSSIRKRRNIEELKTYYPSLAPPETPAGEPQ